MYRVGLGTDIHVFKEGDHVVLGGVNIPHSQSLKGHSDADVIIHAIVDALLGAAGLGDIGEWFPDDADENKDRNSKTFLQDVSKEVRRRGFFISNLDLVVQLELPKLKKYKEQIKNSIAHILDIDESLVNVKAKTNEGVDAIGRQEAISAQCVILLGKNEQKDVS